MPTSRPVHWPESETELYGDGWIELRIATTVRAFCWFDAKFPKLADKLLQSLDGTKQKTLQKEIASFKGDEHDSAAHVFKIPSANASSKIAVKTISTTSAAPGKPAGFVGRNRVNSAKSENPSGRYVVMAMELDIEGG